MRKGEAGEVSRDSVIKGIIAVKRARIFFKHYTKLLEVSGDMI